jgi:hypothetical protein
MKLLMVLLLSSSISLAAERPIKHHPWKKVVVTVAAVTITSILLHQSTGHAPTLRFGNPNLVVPAGTLVLGNPNLVVHK